MIRPKINFLTLIFSNLLSMVIVCLISGLVGSVCIPYAINTWLIYVGKQAVVTKLNGFLFGLFPLFGFLSFVATFFTWIAMLFLL